MKGFDDADGSELTALLPSLYDLLPLPAACSAISEALSESIFKFGKGTKVLTEPLIAWAISPTAQALVGGAEGGELDIFSEGHASSRQNRRTKLLRL